MQYRENTLKKLPYIPYIWCCGVIAGKMRVYLLPSSPIRYPPSPIIQMTRG